MSAFSQESEKTAAGDRPDNIVNLSVAYNPGRWIRAGVVLLVLGIGGFFVWATTAPLDEGVPVPGSLTVEAKRKSVQHISGGIISKIHVSESQLVKTGDVLIELDNTMARSNFDSFNQNYLALRATEGRLRAEQRDAARIEFHPDLAAPENLPAARPFIANQQQLFETRRAALQGDIGILDEAAAAQQESVKGLSAQLASRQSQLRLVQEQISGTRDLVKEGYLPRNTLLEQERTAAELTAVISELQGNILRTGKAISELRLRAIQRRQEHLREVETLLSDVLRDVSSTAARLVAAREELNRTVILAPIDGQVVGLTVFTVGGVIGPGHKLMDIVPIGEPMVLEVKIPPYLIDRVRVGLPADINFHGFVSQPQLVAQGTVLSVSADLLTDPPGVGQPGLLSYYLARIAVTPEGMKKLAGLHMQPGMPADVVIKTGERTLLNYLLKPLLQRLAVSLKES